jgi:hypothetical protein
MMFLLAIHASRHAYRTSKCFTVRRRRDPAAFADRYLLKYQSFAKRDRRPVATPAGMSRTGGSETRGLRFGRPDSDARPKYTSRFWAKGELQIGPLSYH